MAPFLVLLVSAFLVCHQTFVVTAATISNTLAAGVCLCVTEPNVPAFADPTDQNSVISTVPNGLCFVTNGGVFHLNGNTYYLLRNGEQTAWIDSFYLSVGDKSTCSGSNYTAPAYHTPGGTPYSCHVYQGTYKHGEQFVLHNIQCTCDDGAVICSLTDKHCTQDGIVHLSGSTFTLSNHGDCTCQGGVVTCSDGVTVG